MALDLDEGNQCSSELYMCNCLPPCFKLFQLGKWFVISISPLQLLQLVQLLRPPHTSPPRYLYYSLDWSRVPYFRCHSAIEVECRTLVILHWGRYRSPIGASKDIMPDFPSWQHSDRDRHDACHTETAASTSLTYMALTYMACTTVP